MPEALRFKWIKEQMQKRHGVEKTEQMFASFLKSAAKFTASGFSATPPEILADREATCRACPEWDAAALNATGRCRKCGCSAWAKLRMATESCPLGKWKAISSPSALPAPPREPPPAEPLGKLI